MITEHPAASSHILRVILAEFLRYVKYSFTAPLYIFLILFPVITLTIFLMIGVEEFERKFPEQATPHAVVEQTPEDAARSAAFQNWLDGGTMKEDIFRWYGTATLLCYLIGTILRTVSKQLGHEIKPWKLRRKLLVFSLVVLFSYGSVYLLFHSVEGALPFWVAGGCTTIALVVGWFTLSVSHTLDKIITFIHKADLNSLYAPHS